MRVRRVRDFTDTSLWGEVYPSGATRLADREVFAVELNVDVVVKND
ncbi:MAG: hypothetical protein JWM24_185 [Solirubrobacterales bacterium]|nr:hypothetical protein [Solirubrobacterales bacterium]